MPSNPPVPEARTFRFQTGDRATTLDVATVGPRRYRVSDGTRSVFARFEYTGRSTGLLTIFGRRYAAVLVRTAAGVIVEIDGVSHRFSRASDGRLLATVPAAVTFVHVKPGDRVRAGQRLVTFEVMKMEIGQDAPFAGRVAKLHVDSGSRVAAGDPIAIIEAEEGVRADFVDRIAALAAGRAPAMAAASYKAADARLNAAYAAAMKVPEEDMGTVTHAGIRTAQRSWLKYRDVLVAFAKAKWPGVSGDLIAGGLTEARTRQLEAGE